MKRFFIFILLLFIISCKTQEKKHSNDTHHSFTIVIHGGAGYMRKDNFSEEKQKKYKAKLSEAITVGYNILKNGGTSLDAVEQTIKVLEDSPLFNAGKGAVFTHDETNELDASIMMGNTLNAGAVAGVTDVKNPISLAKEVMLNSKHVMLSGKGASAFAQTRGLEMVDATYFRTEKSYQSLQRAKRKKTAQNTSSYNPDFRADKFGTVGCVAIDQQGNITAGTSTGGMTNKRWNRIGDSPIIGAGTYANNATCGVSSTGWGEYFIRGVIAHDISALMEYKNLSLKQAAKIVIQDKLTQMGGTGGIIAVDKNGNFTFEFNTSGMFRASMDENGHQEVKIFKD